MSLHSDFAEMTPQQRRREIAGLLARGVRRLRKRPPESPGSAASQNSRESARNPSPVPPENSIRRGGLHSTRGHLDSGAP